MNPFEQALRSELADIEAAGLLRELHRIEGPPGTSLHTRRGERLNFASNDYLGLAGHPRLAEAARAAVDRFGAGSAASRLICGSLGIHHELEEALAAFKNTEAALTLSSGYAAALGTLGALAGRDDIAIVDKRVHACCVDAARLSGATLRVFRHNDLDHLENILRWTRDRPPSASPRARRVLIVTESVFSMDGDLAPLRELVELKERYGAWMMLDEAHATGVFGERGAGLARERGVSDRIEIQMGTLGKALGAAGGFIAGSRTLVDVLINKARSFIFSTAPVPAATGAALAGLHLTQSSEGAHRRETLWQRANELAGLLAAHTGGATRADSPIVPWILGDEAAAVQAADTLRQSGIFAPAIRFPTVARGQARLRFTVSANHTRADLDQLAAALLKFEI